MNGWGNRSEGPSCRMGRSGWRKCRRAVGESENGGSRRQEQETSRLDLFGRRSCGMRDELEQKMSDGAERTTAACAKSLEAKSRPVQRRRRSGPVVAVGGCRGTLVGVD